MGHTKKFVNMYISISREKQNKFIYLGRLWLSKSSIVQITSLSKKYFKNDTKWMHFNQVWFEILKASCLVDDKETGLFRIRNALLCIFYHVTWVFPHCLVLQFRAVGRSENLGVPVLFGGHNMPPLVEIGLADLPKLAPPAPPAPPATTGLH